MPLTKWVRQPVHARVKWADCAGPGPRVGGWKLSLSPGISGQYGVEPPAPALWEDTLALKELSQALAESMGCWFLWVIKQLRWGGIIKHVEFFIQCQDKSQYRERSGNTLLRAFHPGWTGSLYKYPRHISKLLININVKSYHLHFTAGKTEAKKDQSSYQPHTERLWQMWEENSLLLVQCFKHKIFYKATMERKTHLAGWGSDPETIGYLYGTDAILYVFVKGETFV